MRSLWSRCVRPMANSVTVAAQGSQRSEMLFDELIDRPSQYTLDRVLDGACLDLVAPFATRGALQQLDPARHDRVRIVTRLPRPFDALPRRLDNDPRHFIDLMARFGRNVHVYAMPSVHTKLYLNGSEAFYGSANLTSFGFGSNPESLLVTSDTSTYRRLSAMFSDYRTRSERVSKAFLDKLARYLLRGALEYSPAPEQPVLLRANPVGDDEAHFRSWLRRQPGYDPVYIEARFDPASGYNMVGHAQSGFPGIRAFLRDNLDLIPTLANATYSPRAFWRSHQDVASRLREFIILRGHGFPAAGGGDWRRKLPASLGGWSTGGGRGSGLVARLLIFLARYARDEGF